MNKHSQARFWKLIEIKWTAVLLLAPGLTACVTGPKRENDTVLDKLNGNNYKAYDAASVNNVGLPLVYERQAATTRISGTVSGGCKPLSIPLKNKTVVLKQNQKELFRTMTDAAGAYTFAGSIPNGRYIVSLEPKTSEKKDPAIEREVVVDRYEVKDIELVVTPSKCPAAADG